jgi:hypothetical protein
VSQLYGRQVPVHRPRPRPARTCHIGLTRQRHPAGRRHGRAWRDLRQPGAGLWHRPGGSGNASPGLPAIVPAGLLVGGR